MNHEMGLRSPKRPVETLVNTLKRLPPLPPPASICFLSTVTNSSRSIAPEPSGSASFIIVLNCSSLISICAAVSTERISAVSMKPLPSASNFAKTGVSFDRNSAASLAPALVATLPLAAAGTSSATVSMARGAASEANLFEFFEREDSVLARAPLSVDTSAVA